RSRWRRRGVGACWLLVVEGQALGGREGGEWSSTPESPSLGPARSGSRGDALGLPEQAALSGAVAAEPLAEAQSLELCRPDNLGRGTSGDRDGDERSLPIRVVADQIDGPQRESLRIGLLRCVSAEAIALRLGLDSHVGVVGVGSEISRRLECHGAAPCF